MSLFLPAAFLVDAAATPSIPRCTNVLAASDANRDNDLARVGEFPRFVSVLSHNTYNTFEETPPGFQEVYNRYAVPPTLLDITGSHPGSNPTPDQSQRIQALCTEFIAVLPTVVAPVVTPAPVPVPVVGPVTPSPPASSPAVPFNTCRVSMAVSDANRDDLLSQQEYVTFLNRITANRRGFTAFATLPAGLQTTYASLAGAPNQQLPIIGASPAEFISATDVQKYALEQICNSVQAALNDGGLGTSPPINPIVTAAPAPATMPFPQCRVSLAITDTNRDNEINANEYVTFVNRLSQNRYAGTSFDLLPAPLQTNFNTLAAATQPTATMGIVGAQPAQYTTATDSQKAFLERICTDTQTFTTQPATTTTPPAITPVPATIVPVVTSPPCATCITFIQCRARMHGSDVNQDSFLNPEEYAIFVDRLAGPTVSYPNYASLPLALQNTYTQFALINGQISIDGALPSQAVDAAQLAFLENVCTATQLAIQSGQVVIPPTLPPSTILPVVTMPPSTITPATVAPTTEAPTTAAPSTEAPTAVFDNTVMIDNSFIVYNTLGLSGDDLNVKQDDQFVEPGAILLARNYLVFTSELVSDNPWPPQTQVPLAPLVTTPPLAAVATGTPGTTLPPVARYLRSRERRHLVVAEIGQAWIREFQNTTCPPELTVPAAICSLALAQYKLARVEENEAEAVKNYYEVLSQSHVNAGVPNLKDKNAANTLLFVYGPTDELIRYIPPETLPPQSSSNGFCVDASCVDPKDPFAIGMVIFLLLLALAIYLIWNDKDRIKRKWRAFKRKQRRRMDEEENEDADLDGEEGNKVGGEEDDEDYEDVNDSDEYEDEYDVEDPKNGKKSKRKKLLGTLGKNVGKIKNKVGLGDNEDDEDLGFGFEDENLLDFNDYVFDTPAELLTEQNNGDNKFGDETAGKDRGGRDATKRAAGLVAAVGHPSAMSDSVASSTSSMEGSDMSEEDDHDEYGFDNEYDSDDSEEDEDEDFDFSDSDDGEDTISSKGDDLQGEEEKDDGSLSSSDEQGAEAALEGGDVEGMLTAARTNGESGEGGPGDGESDGDGSESGSSYYSESTSSSHVARLAEYRNEVKELVTKVIPEELDNLSTMMDQFEGREAELINTLQNMEERTSTQRARAAVHKTKVKVNPNQVGGYSIASEGSAVIAAASTLGPEPQRRQPRVQQYDDYDDYDDYGDEYSDEGSYYDDEYYDDYGDEGSYYSDEGSYYDEDGNYVPAAEGSYYSDEEGSYYEDDYDDGYDDEQGSYYSGEEEGSYYSGEEGSYYSGEEGEEGSYVSGEGSYDDDGYGDEQSYYSGEEEGSYYSGEEGEEGSYVSGEGSYDDDEGYSDDRSYYSGEEDEGSYYSGEEGSYVSGEEDDYYDDEYEDGSYDDGGR